MTFTFNGTAHVKPLVEDDFKYLFATQFRDWKTFISHRYLKQELDITDQSKKSLSRIMEAHDEDGDLNDRLSSSDG